MSPSGRIETFRSRVDGDLHPCAVCATDTGSEPKPLILEVSPGALGNLDKCVARTEEMAGWALQHGLHCVVLRPTGRGNGSVYQHFGEVDLFEAIDHVEANYAIDVDRISITGASMGGAATWYMISHYPDFFAAAAPLAGYCDYRLWEKPGGFAIPMYEWEEPSWIARSAVFLIDNMKYTPLWIVHGEWDRAVGGGVSVEQSRQMARLLAEKGYDFKYTEVPETGHSCRSPELMEQVVLWLLSQRKNRSPDAVTHCTYTLRHNRSYWLSIDQLGEYGARGMVQASIVGENRISVSTENVQTFSVSSQLGMTNPAIEIDGVGLGRIDLKQAGMFQKGESGQWWNGSCDLSKSKRHGVSGPIGDLFYDGVILVPGTTGTAHETHVARDMARKAVQYYASRNGGVHRGGKLGDNDVQLPVVDDVDLSDSLLEQHNLILYGTPASNSILARFEDKLPISFRPGRLTISDRQYASDGCAAFAAFPHPRNANGYVAVHGGTTADAICWGSHLDMHLLPDYIVYARGELLDWGFWDNEWKSPVH